MHTFLLQLVSEKYVIIVMIYLFDLLGCTQNVLKYGVLCLQQVLVSGLLWAI